MIYHIVKLDSGDVDTRTLSFIKLYLSLISRARGYLNDISPVVDSLEQAVTRIASDGLKTYIEPKIEEARSAVAGGERKPEHSPMARSRYSRRYICS